MFAYLITNTVNGKKYVGIAKNVARRLNRHRYDAKAPDSPIALYRAIAKYGVSKFRVRTIACARTWNDLCEVERLLIKQHNSHVDEYGYNMTLGGDGGFGRKMSSEQRSMHSELKKVTPQTQLHTPEAIAKQSAARVGKKRSPETRAKMSATAKARGAQATIHTPEAQARAAEARRGQKRSPEHCAALSVALTGIKHRPWTEEERAAIGERSRGRKHSPETIAKMSAIKRATPQLHLNTPEAKAKALAARQRRAKYYRPLTSEQKVA